MTTADSFKDGFPYLKVEAAKRYLCLVKPWWSRYLSRMEIIPIALPIPPDSQYGALTSTDKSMRLFIDRNFALSVGVDKLAGALDRELQHHIRDSWGRLSWVGDSDRVKYLNVCMDLEINSSIRSEIKEMDEADKSGRAYTMAVIRKMCTMSMLFSADDYKRWNIQTPPDISDECWLPEMFDLPDGLSAESYYREMKRKDEEAEQEEQDQEGSEPDDPEEPGEEKEQDQSSDQPHEEQDDQQDDDRGDSEQDESGGPDQDDDESDQDQEPGSNEGDDSGDDEDDGQSDPSEGSDDDDSEEDGAGDQEQLDKQQDDSGGDPEQQDGDGSEGEDPTEGEGEQDGSDGDQEGDGEPDGPEGDGEPGEEPSQSNPSENPGQGGDGQGEPSADQQDSQQTSGQQGDGHEGMGSGNPQSSSQASNKQTIDERIDELRAESPSLDWWSREIAPDDETPQWMPDDLLPETDENDPLSMMDKDRREADRELAEDISDAAKAAASGRGFGLSPGTSLMDWSETVIERSGAGWKGILSKILSSTYLSAQIQGASDLTYSVRNPNQPQIGPVFMGLKGYAPVVYVLQDVSGSMASFMDRALSSFNDIVRASVDASGEPVVWITADTSVIDVGKSVNVDKDLIAKMSVGWGGTVFSKIIEEIVRGKLVFKGKRYPAPDVLIISTDCMFGWPWKESKRVPFGNTKIIVSSVKSYDDIGRFLPPWVKDRKNFVHIDF